VKRATFITLAVTAAWLAVAAAPASAKVRLTKVGSFQSPTYVTSAPGTPGIFVVEQAGRVISVNGYKRRRFLNIAPLVTSGGEQGLLSIAFPPNYAASGLFYAFYTGRDGDLHIAEFHRASKFKADPKSLRTVLVIPHPNFDNHNGGQLQFGPDGYLYISTGDGGGSWDPEDEAQRTDSLLGKILRIDPTKQGSAPYTSPASNALGAGAGRDEIFEMGLRNPWRFSFDRKGILIGDVGQNKSEEIDYETFATANGANFGWNDFEGFGRFPAPNPPDPTRYDRPIYAYPHDDGACAVIGGYVKERASRDRGRGRGGRTKPRALRASRSAPTGSGFNGRYVFGDLCTGKIQTLVPKPEGARDVRTLNVKVPMLTSFGVGANGALYATSLDGPVYRFK
jgi:glucose/arabinose dehydrogenase